MLKGKTIVVGVSGGIAAYKAVDVVSKLKVSGADVRVIMTDNAAKFVTPLTFQTISQNPVSSDMFSEPKRWEIEHISLAAAADLILVAPATANILGKAANGVAGDLLSTTIMAARSKVLFVPSMNDAMYENPITQRNMKMLTELGYLFVEPEEGRLASGAAGKGRFPETSVILDRVIKETR